VSAAISPSLIQQTKINDIRTKLGETGAVLVPILFNKTAITLALTSSQTLLIEKELSYDNLSAEELVARIRRSVIVGDDGFPPPFDLASAAELSERALGGVLPHLQRQKTLFFVPIGAMQSVPVSVLVTDPEAAKSIAGRQPIDYPSVPWIDKKYAVATVPGFSVFGPTQAAGFSHKVSVLAMADPSLNENASCKKPLTRIFDDAGNLLPERLRSSFCQVASTRDVLAAAVRLFGLSPDDMKLRTATGESATKGTLRKWAEDPILANSRILILATHGLLADDTLKKVGLAEPALILTPPLGDHDVSDDGLLLMSQIPPLQLHPDWVVLTACNTAGPNGRPGAEGLSGLTRAFMEGGANGVLVTNWFVPGNAISELTGDLLKDYIAHDDGMAIAMQRVLNAWRTQRAGKPAPYQHPYYWASYTIATNLETK
jgi:CHAT domain-containing protein